MEKIKKLINKIKKFVESNKPSLETLKQATMRGVEAGLSAGFISFSGIPVNLYNPRKYLLAALIGFGTGFVTGLIKFVRGYIKYDLK